MSKLIAIISQQSWRDIILTALLASSILYYFVFKNSGYDVSSSNNDTQEVASAEERERRRRRDHLAKIAEERAKRIATTTTITAAAAADIASASDKVKRVKEESNKAAAKATSSITPHVTSAETKANNILIPKEAGTKTAASNNRIEKKTSVHKNEKRDAINFVSTAPKDPNKLPEKTGSNDVSNAAANVSNNEKEVAVTLPTTSGTKVAQEKNGQESITIYLIKSASPRIEITIPKNATPSQLRLVAADASCIPVAGLRLIFRGRMIVEKSIGDGVVKEFGIEEGSALHVVGKPNNTSSSSSSSTAAAPPSQPQQQPPPPSLPHQDMTRLIQQGLQGNPNFFHYAAAAGNYELVQAAIRDGSFNTQLNRADENDWTPLHEAIRGGHQRVVTLLLDEGGLDMHAITNQGDGFSPLSLSIDFHGDHPLTRMLRDRGGQEVWPDEDSESSSSDEEEEAEENPWINS